MPVLRFDKAAQWTPHPVDDYLDQSKLIRPGEPDESSPDLDDLQRGCANPFTDPCFKLTIKCPKPRVDGDDPCPSRQPHDPLGRQAVPGRGRVRARGEAGCSASARAQPVRELRAEGHPGRPGDPGPILVLLRLRRVGGACARGPIVQRHEADWEAVTVGLATNRPRCSRRSPSTAAACGSAGAGRTCTSSTLGRRATPGGSTSHPGAEDLGDGPSDWNEARADRTHPAVSVALGSQANYPPAQADVSPNWASQG